jgi:nucleoside-diphosphate-sugar epimerase
MTTKNNDHDTFATSSTTPPTVPSRPRSEATRLVVGCGYLGTRVARRWLAAGDRVFGITRSPARAAELAAIGITPIVYDVTAASGSSQVHTLDALPPFDTVFWAVGFDRTSGATHRDVHVDGLARLLDALKGSPRVILSSSTGVWGDEGGGIVTEDTPTNPSREAGHVLVEAESLLRSHAKGPGVALRFAGLYGPDRLPRLDDLKAGRPIAADPESWLNLIHIDDAAAVVCAVAAAVTPRPLYVVSDGHPVLRRDWYGHLAAITGSPSPHWEPSLPRARGADKQVDPALLFRDLPIPLAHPDPLRGIEKVLQGSM